VTWGVIGLIAFVRQSPVHRHIQARDTDNRNPPSEFLLHVLGAAAEFERELIRERSKAGRDCSGAVSTKGAKKEGTASLTDR